MMRTNKLIILILILLYSNISYSQTISRSEYKDKLRGFWLGSCIANWTGLKTEGQRNTKPYYTDKVNGKYEWEIDQQGRPFYEGT